MPPEAPASGGLRFVSGRSPEEKDGSDSSINVWWLGSIDRPDYVAEVRSVTADGRPLDVAFRFRVPLEDPRLRWLFWEDGRLRPFPLPRVGETVAVKSSPLIR